MTEIQNSKPKIICLITSVRGGSKLFHSLLDGHPQIICLPRTFRMTEFISKIQNLSNDSQKIADSFCQEYPRFFNGNIWHIYNRLDKANKLGINGNESFNIDQNKFKTEFIKIYTKSDKTSKSLFLAIHYAFQLAKDLEIPKNPYILYHPHDIGHIGDIKLCIDDFGVNNVKLIFATRHPVDGLNAALRTYIFQNNLTPLNFYYKETMVFTSQVYELFPNADLKIVPLEIIRSRRQEVMQQLCEWTGLTWDKILNESTMMGKAWAGNAQENKGDTVFKLEWFKSSSWLDKKDNQIYCTLFPKRMKAFGQQTDKIVNSKFKLSLLVLCPTKQEWESLKLSFSPKFWKNYINNIINELNDPSFSYNNKIRGQYTKSQVFLRKIKSALLPTLMYFYIKRIFISLSFVFKRKTEDKIELLYNV